MSRVDEYMKSDLIKKVKKKYGAGSLMKARDDRVRRVGRIPTGIFFLDIALGGGVPIGRVNIFWGHKSTGKTAICMKTVASAQRMCMSCHGYMPCECKNPREPVCVYVDVEGTFDNEWAEKLGVDPDELIVSQPEFAEKALDMTEAHLRSGEVDLVVLDSLAMLTPSKEIEESTAKALQAEQARIVGRAVRKFNSALNFCGEKFGRRPTILFVNQVRHKLGVMFGSPETQPAGFAPGFAATTEVHTLGQGGKYEMDDTTGKALWVDMKFRIDKNKADAAKMEGEWRLILQDTETKKVGDVADEQTLVEVGKKLGLITGAGSSWECLGEKYRGASKVTERLLTDPDFSAVYRNAVQEILAN